MSGYNTHKQTAAKYLFTAFALAVLTISALTSFAFFYNHFAGLLPAGLLDAQISRLISGIVGMTLFDLACTVWLIAFLHHAETSEQRAISLIMSALAFIGAGAASVAHLGLTATGDLALDPATRSTVAIVALVVVILGVVLNFGAATAYQRFSIESKAAVREADRRDRIQAAEDEQAAYLDGLIAQSVKEQLTEAAPDLARQQAARIAGRFYRHENSKYADGSQQGNGSGRGTSRRLSPPSGQPQREQQTNGIGRPKRDAGR